LHHFINYEQQHLSQTTNPFIHKSNNPCFSLFRFPAFRFCTFYIANPDDCPTLALQNQRTWKHADNLWCRSFKRRIGKGIGTKIRNAVCKQTCCEGKRTPFQCWNYVIIAANAPGARDARAKSKKKKARHRGGPCGA
jgi:hypothetical protein